MSSKKIDESRARLFAGVRRFQLEVYPQRKAEYQKLAREGQKPHALFITCADSRIDPELITQSGPGEIFVARNIGNIVPAYGEVLGGVSAIIEYAVSVLEVSQVVVCGHTECGAMDGLLHPKKVASFPIVTSWLRHGETALSIVRHTSKNPGKDPTLDELTEQNVVLQLQHLRTHPSVAGRMVQGALGLSGWVYDIAHGDVRVYDESKGRFLPVAGEEQAASSGSSKGF
jgi:carbonic anhydrase